MWAEIMKKKDSQERQAFDFFFEERIWYLASVLEEGFNLDKISESVTQTLTIKMQEGKQPE